MPLARSLLVLSAAVSLAACGSSSAPTPPATPPQPAVSATWDGADTLDAFGATGRVRATVRRGGLLVTDQPLVYSSDQSAVASVNPFTGEVTAAGNGTARITVRAAGSDTTGATAGVVSVTVRQRAASVQILRAATALPLDGTRQLAARVLDRLGAAIADAPAVTFATTTPALLALASDGRATPRDAGSATITATLPRPGLSALVSSTALEVTAERFATTATVEMLPESYAPAVVRIAAGGSVTWTNGVVTHDAIFNAGSDAPPDIPRGRNFTATRVFPVAGVFGYVCTLHANMVGRIEVH